MTASAEKLVKQTIKLLAKIHSLDYDELKHDAKKLVKENNFLRAINDLRRANAVSDVKEVETTLENIVGAWPSLVFLNQNSFLMQ